MKHMKRVLMVVMAFTLLFATVTPDFADARRGGGFKSGRQGFTTTPKQSNTQQSNTQQSNVNRNDNTRNGSATTTGTAANTGNRGFFSGGGLMRGLMIGGLAGMMFGGLFGGMGMLGNILGLMINMLAIFAIVGLAMSLYQSFKRRREEREREERMGRY